MSRVLFVVPPLVGHVNPTVAVGAELAARGHEVAWAGHPDLLAALLPAGARVFPVAADTIRLLATGVGDRPAGMRGFAALKYLWQEFIIPLAQGMLPGVEAAIAAYAPDVVVADQQVLAGAAAARRAGIAWVTSVSTPAELTRPLGAMPKVGEWITAQITAFQREIGVDDPVDLRFSDRLMLVFSTPELTGEVGGFAGKVVFTGPALAGRPERGQFPWEWLDPGRRHLLVSLGTVNGEAGQRFFRVAVEALAGLGSELQAILLCPPVPGAPDHVLFAEHVPQLALLPHLSAVVSHGGNNTVCETLAHGLPLVLAPIRDDQPVIAQQVADAGAGIRLSFARVSAPELRAAVRAVLDDPSYRHGAAKIAQSFAAAGGARAAADHVEELL
ncbi:MAG TPA: nucleotide disphospho-sugar-binding domain-containing protein [Trebonia sp.]|jgi:MGT family glycosyltransferase|nr:nucleotide disphospho-sugar-binding domain-containing protein [Trebonia sp.]